MKYFVTFGQRYRRTPHPFFYGAHPDGWVEVDAPDMPTARAEVDRALGPFWAELYSSATFERELFPAGRIGTIVGGTVVPWAP